MDFYAQLLAKQQQVAQQRDNEARDGTDLLRIESHGAGQIVLAELHRFANPLVFKPDVSYGSEIITPADLEVWQWPRCTGSVARWETNDRNFYIGVYVVVSVDIEPIHGTTPVGTPSAHVEHHFAFRSLSYKTLGSFAQGAVEDPTLPTHRTPF